MPLPRLNRGPEYDGLLGDLYGQDRLVTIDWSGRTVAEARVHMAGHPDMICPCCDREPSKARTRTLNANMALILVKVVQRFEQEPPPEDGWLHVLDYLKSCADVPSKAQGGDYAKLEQWGLLESKSRSKGKGKGKSAGFWRSTSLAVEFVHGRVTVPAWKIVKDEEVIDTAEEMIDIRTALTPEFEHFLGTAP